MNIKNKLYHILFFLLLFIDSIYVYGQSESRIIFTGLLTALVILSKPKVSKVAVSIGVCLIYSLLIGLIKFPESSLSESKIIIFTFLYGIIISYKCNINILLKSLFYISWILNIYLTLSVVFYLLGNPLDYSFLPSIYYGLTDDDMLGYGSSSLQALSFFLVFNGIYYFKNKSIYSAIPFVLGIINVILSQRRALLLFPFIIMTFYLIKNADLRILFRMLVALLGGALLLSIILPIFTNTSTEGYLQSLLNLMQFDDDSDGARVTQFYKLLDLLFDSPIIGSGFGAYNSTCIRSTIQPYSYELAILSLLTKLGIPIFCYVFYNYFKYLYKYCFDENRLPLVLGSFCLFLANLTNPYLNVSTILLLILPFINISKNSYEKTNNFSNYSLL